MQDVLDHATENEMNCNKIRRAHYIAWEKQANLNLILGLTVILLTAITGTAIFLSVQSSIRVVDPLNTDIFFSISIGILSFLAAILSALQTFLKPSEKAEAHKAAAARFAAMKREFKLFKLMYSDKDLTSRDQAIDELKGLNSKLDFYAENCVALSDSAMLKAEKELSTLRAAKAKATDVGFITH